MKNLDLSNLLKGYYKETSGYFFKPKSTGPGDIHVSEGRKIISVRPSHFNKYYLTLVIITLTGCFEHTIFVQNTARYKTIKVNKSIYKLNKNRYYDLLQRREKCINNTKYYDFRLYYK